MFYNIDHKFYEIQHDRVFYLLLTGLSYREIAEKFYYRQRYKFVYEVRKLMKSLNLNNRRQLAYFAVKNNLVDIEKIRFEQND